MQIETEKTFDPKEFHKSNFEETEIPIRIEIEPLEQKEILELSEENIKNFLDEETEWIREKIKEQELYIELQAENVEKGLVTQEEGEEEIRAACEEIQKLENRIEDEKLETRTNIKELSSLSTKERENRFEKNTKNIEAIEQALNYLIDSTGDSVRPFAEKLLEDLKNFERENRIIEFLKKSKTGQGEIKAEEIATIACG